MANDINGPLRNVLPGNIDDWNKVYTTVAEANGAIPNTIVGSRNFREGKVVQIGTVTDHIEHHWQGGFEDINLIPKAPPSVLFDDEIITPEIPASLNILNPSARSLNASSMNNLGVVTYSGSTTDFFSIDIPVSEISNLVTGKNGVPVAYWRSAQFDSDNTFITGTFIDNGATNTDTTKAVISVNPSASFVRILARKAESVSPYAINQINTGNTIQAFDSYQPFVPAVVKKVGNKDGGGNVAKFAPNVNDPDLNANFSTKEQGVGFSESIKRSTNLYDFATASQVNGFINSATGSIGSSAAGTYHPSPFIEWLNEESLISVGLNGAIPSEGAYSVLQYDSNYAPISGSWSGTAANVKTINKYQGAKYVRVSLREGRSNQLNFGSIVLPYEAYYSPIVTKIADKDATGTAVKFTPDIEDESLLNAFTSKSFLNDSILANEGVISKYKQISVKLDGTGDYTNLATALFAAAANASPSQPYLVKLYDDIFATQESHYTLVTDIYYALGLVSDYITLIGMNGIRTLYGTLPTNLAKLTYERYETLHVDGKGMLINIRLEARNIRYAGHYERSNGSINWDGWFRQLNCEAYHHGCLDVPVETRWAAPEAWGTGVTTGVRYDWNGATNIGARYGARIHSNTLDNFPNHFKLKDSYFGTKSSDGVSLYIDNTPTSRESRIVEMNGCQLEGSFNFIIDMNTATSVVNKIIPSIKVFGSGNTPFYAQNSQSTGQALRVKSNTTGETSIVSVVSDQANLFGTKKQINGSLGLSGQIYGDHELIESGTADRRNKIGHRLGDCSVTPKTLVLNIDGTNRTVTFNQNYSNGVFTDDPLIDATTILASINSQLSGFAVADYFQVNLEYYPELTDVLFYKGNISTTAFIPRGSFVKFVGLNRCRLAVEGEIPDGMAIDDMPVPESSGLLRIARVIKKCIVANAGRFTPLFNGTYTTGDCFKLDSLGRLQKDATLKDSFAIALSVNRILIK